MLRNFKNISLLSAVLLMLVLTVNAENYVPVQENIATLSDWSNQCFKEFIEYSEGAKPIQISKIRIYQPSAFPETFLKKEEFSGLVRTFADRCRMTMSDPNKWLGDSPLDGLFDTKSELPNTGKALHPFVQKLVVPSGSNICFIGDLHGSVHSLLRNLWRLVALGWLGNDFKLVKPNRYIIFNGDFVDRGRYGVECIYTLLRLKLANWDNVFLLRGNHEEIGISQTYGFAAELHKKFNVSVIETMAVKDILDVWDNFEKSEIAHFYELLPFALFLGSGIDTENENKPHFVQCCHGGIETGYDPKSLFDDKTGKVFERISDEVTVPLCSHEKEKKNNYSGFNWSDFEESGQIDNDNWIAFNTARGAGYLADVEYSKNFTKKKGFKAFFRGHQDRVYGFKMFFGSWAKKEEKENNLISQGVGFESADYSQGPYHWRYVVDDDKQKTPLDVDQYAPVFTFSTAAEGQGVPYDCFGILQTADDYTDWQLTPYEYSLEGHPEVDGKTNRQNRQEKNHTKLLFKNSDVVTHFYNPDKKYGATAQPVSELAGIEKNLIVKAIQNQIDRLELEQKNRLKNKLKILQDALKALRARLLMLQGSLGNLRSALHAS